MTEQEDFHDCAWKALYAEELAENDTHEETITTLVAERDRLAGALRRITILADWWPMRETAREALAAVAPEGVGDA